MRHEACITSSGMISSTWRDLLSQDPSARTSPKVLCLVDPRVAGDARRQAWVRGWRWLQSWLQMNTFTPPWLPRRWRHPIAGYVLAFLSQVGVAILTHVLIGGIPTYSFPGVVEILTVALIAVSWGAGPGIFAALTGLALEEILVLDILNTFGTDILANWVEGIVFMVVGIGVSVVAGRTERSRRKAVAERAQAQAHAQAMHELFEQMDQFLDIASHDLRTPLTALIGFIEVATSRFERLALALKERSADLSAALTDQVTAVRVGLDNARQSAARLRQLADLLLDATRIRAAIVSLHRVPCDLSLLVQDQLAMLRAVYPDRSLRLEVTTEQPLPVLADTDRIGQVMTNYVANAVKYSPDDQPVDVQISRAGRHARVAIRDHGAGLPESEQARVWQRFYRAEGVPIQSGSGVGLGLGLYICKSIIESHGGEVGIESVVGQGATFWFTLPLANPTA